MYSIYVKSDICLWLFYLSSSGVVLFLIGELIFLGSSGELKKKQDLALAILEQNKAANETMVSTSTETFVDQWYSIYC